MEVTRDTALVFIAITLIWIGLMLQSFEPYVKETFRLISNTYNNTGCVTGFRPVEKDEK